MKTMMMMVLMVMGAGLASAGDFNLNGMDLEAVRGLPAEVSVNLPQVHAGAVERKFPVLGKEGLTKDEASQELKKIFEAASPYFAEVLCGKYTGKLFVFGTGDIADINMELICKSPDFGPLFNAAPELQVALRGVPVKAVSTPEGLAFSTSSSFRYVIRQHGDFLIIKETFGQDMVSYGYFWAR